MAPPVAPASQVWRPVAAGGRERSRNFDNLHPEQRRLHDHLAGELHASGLQVHAAVGLHAEAAQAAVEVSAMRVKEEPSQKTQHWVAKIPVQKRHGAFLNASAKPVAHHEVSAGAQLLQEFGNVAKVVTRICVAHDYVSPARRRDTAHQSVAVTAIRHGSNSRAQ